MGCLLDKFKAMFAVAHVLARCPSGVWECGSLCGCPGNQRGLPGPRCHTALSKKRPCDVWTSTNGHRLPWWSRNM